VVQHSLELTARAVLSKENMFLPAIPVSYLSISVSHCPAKWFYKQIVLSHGRRVYTRPPRKIFRLVLQ